MMKKNEKNSLRADTHSEEAQNWIIDILFDTSEKRKLKTWLNENQCSVWKIQFLKNRVMIIKIHIETLKWKKDKNKKFNK